MSLHESVRDAVMYRLSATFQDDGLDISPSHEDRLAADSGHRSEAADGFTTPPVKKSLSADFSEAGPSQPKKGSEPAGTLIDVEDSQATLDLDGSLLGSGPAESQPTELQSESVAAGLDGSLLGSGPAESQPTELQSESVAAGTGLDAVAAVEPSVDGEVFQESDVEPEPTARKRPASKKPEPVAKRPAAGKRAVSKTESNEADSNGADSKKADPKKKPAAKAKPSSSKEASKDSSKPKSKAPKAAAKPDVEIDKSDWDYPQADRLLHYEGGEWKARLQYM